MNPSSTLSALLAVATLAGCATLSPDNDAANLAQLTAGKTAGVSITLASASPQATHEALGKLLSEPLTAESAVRIALLNNPGLQVSMATLAISDAQRVQAATLPNPHLSLGRFIEGNTVENERGLGFSVLGLLALPWRAKWQSQQHEYAKLQAAQEVIKVAAATRKAWINAVAAQQTAQYMMDAQAAAQASGELARRMARVGNWSRLEQAREQLALADATTQLAKAQQAAFSEREQLTRLLGLWGTQSDYRLSPRLPDIPKAPQALSNIERQALMERLDVQASVAEADQLANALGLVRAGYLADGLNLSYTRSVATDRSDGHRETKRGWELEFPIPLFDWGGAATARASGLHREAVARARQTAIQARSEAREAYHGYRTAFDVAVHYRDEVVPLRKFISNEMLLRYNGMLIGVFDLLGDMRLQIAAVNGAIGAQRDFWLAEVDLQTTLSGTSTGGLATMKPDAGNPQQKAGH